MQIQSFTQFYYAPAIWSLLPKVNWLCIMNLIVCTTRPFWKMNVLTLLLPLLWSNYCRISHWFPDKRMLLSLQNYLMRGREPEMMVFSSLYFLVQKKDSKEYLITCFALLPWQVYCAYEKRWPRYQRFTRQYSPKRRNNRFIQGNHFLSQFLTSIQVCNRPMFYSGYSSMSSVAGHSGQGTSRCKGCRAHSWRATGYIVNLRNYDISTTNFSTFLAVWQIFNSNYD